jgi:hypothetical protein
LSSPDLSTTSERRPLNVLLILVVVYFVGLTLLATIGLSFLALRDRLDAGKNAAGSEELADLRLPSD